MAKIIDNKLKEIQTWVTGWARNRFFERSSYQNAYRGDSQSGLPIVLDNNGKIDSNFLDIGEVIADAVGAMVTGNTETGVTVTYQDSDNTLDFDAQTAGDARYLKQSANTQTVTAAATNPVSLVLDSSAHTEQYSSYSPKASGNYGQFVAFGTAFSGSRFGQLLADAVEVLAVDASRLLIGALNAVDIIFGTADTERMRITSAGRVGIGVTAPRSIFHIRDTLSGHLYADITVDSATITIIPNGTGDVIGIARCFGVARDSSGAVWGISVSSAVSGDNDAINDGTNIVKFRVNADGSVDIRRTGGSRTYVFSISIWWT